MVILDGSQSGILRRVQDHRSLLGFIHWRFDQLVTRFHKDPSAPDQADQNDFALLWKLVHSYALAHPDPLCPRHVHGNPFRYHPDSGVLAHNDEIGDRSNPPRFILVLAKEVASLRLLLRIHVFVVSKIANLSLKRLSIHVSPHITVITIYILSATYFPFFSTWLPGVL